MISAAVSTFFSWLNGPTPRDYQNFVKWFGGDRKISEFSSEEIREGIRYSTRRGEFLYYRALMDEAARRRNEKTGGVK